MTRTQEKPNLAGLCRQISQWEKKPVNLKHCFLLCNCSFRISTLHRPTNETARLFCSCQNNLSWSSDKFALRIWACLSVLLKLKKKTLKTAKFTFTIKRLCYYRAKSEWDITFPPLPSTGEMCWLRCQDNSTSRETKRFLWRVWTSAPNQTPLPVDGKGPIPYLSTWALIPSSSTGQRLLAPTDKDLIQHFEVFPSPLQRYKASGMSAHPFIAFWFTCVSNPGTA